MYHYQISSHGNVEVFTTILNSLKCMLQIAAKFICCKLIPFYMTLAQVVQILNYYDLSKWLAKVSLSSTGRISISFHKS
jgi:hypothetical protein